MTRFRSASLVIAVLSVPVALPAQTAQTAQVAQVDRSAQRVGALSLRDALARADAHAFANRIADGRADVQAGEALAAYRGILPSVRVEAGFVRTTDPIGAFGTTLRQRAITAADFDPARLNFPAAVGNRSAGLVLEQPLFNADAWMGRRAGAAATGAARAGAEWTRRGTSTDVIRAYFGATLAREKRSTLDAAERAAQAHVARARALSDTGLVTRSDVLLAEVRAGEITAQRLAATGEAEHAARALAVLLGEPGSSNELPTTLPTADAIRALVAGDTSETTGETTGERAGDDAAMYTGQTGTRADVRAATLAVDASRADTRRARAAYLPRVNGFARYDWNDPRAYFANERSWTVGVMASWSPFAGASEIAEVRATSGRARTAVAQFEAATAQAGLETARTRTELQVALAQLDIAERAVAQSVEAHRIVVLKYDGGLATISELLEASALETQSRLSASFATYRLLVTAAERRQALGADPAFLATLTTP
ncbi:MAG: TolC family protein [Gemmatimonadota bacterium]|nr:TolC family protein [Gemmatimonadota bacterium]